MILSCPVAELGLASPLTKIRKVEIFLLDTLILQIRFRLLSDIFSTMYLYWEQIVIENYYGNTYSLYVANVGFNNNFIDNFRNVRGAQAITSNKVTAQKA
jgi:hypothetical protein